ncbi:haloalkane dehalogenase [Denitrobaculum tricleocarpae]|uniref:Haloalkane dehalogenase n=1 Tax=Denitrobaculum tricleocarpae TaxID=2591009 RepID=A0A545TMX9_9PROT|nr:haloalkane dehalogenase [Denitrobaculum tricleocarpae]TQV78564.1 haloalkane dehalogenase [Denitrobaculum tricleocarpae]
MTQFPKNALPRKKLRTVLGKKMAYVEVGEGDPIVFLHGVPTSSYLWRNVMSHLEGKGRLIAPDLIGMGDSEKLDNTADGSYSIPEHSRYLFALLEELDVKENVTFVLHDWGSGLGFHWAERNRGAVKQMAFMEAIPSTFPTWDDFPEAIREVIGKLRSPEGDKMALEENFFIETLLPAAILRDLTEEEHAVYRKPYLSAGEDRRPTLAGPRQLSIEGSPADTTAIIEAYGEYLSKSEDLPKLFINAEPGAFLVGYARDFVRTWPNLTEVTVAGAHFIQEDSPDEIGKAIADWMR